MLTQKKFWVITIYLIPILACSIFGSSEGGDAALDADLSAATATQAAGEETVIEDVETVKEEEAEIVEDSSATLSDDAQTVIFESAQNLKNLKSYRSKTTMEQEGQTTETLYEYELPDNFRMVTNVGGQTTEMIGIGDDLYMKAGDSWTAMPGAGTGSDNMGTTVARTDLPKESIQDARLEGSEEVNGVSTQKYVYTAKLEDTPSMEVIAWIGIEDGLPHKIVTHNEQWTVTQMLYDFNADITIAAPEVDSAASGSGVESGVGDTDTGDMPVLDDAEEVMSMAGFTNYYTGATIAGVVDFYRQKLPALGWTENADQAYTDESNALLNFGKDEQTLMLTVTLEEGRTSVIITIIDQ